MNRISKFLDLAIIVLLALANVSYTAAQRPMRSTRQAAASGPLIGSNAVKGPIAFRPDTQMPEAVASVMEAPSQPTVGLVIHADLDPSITGDPNSAQIQQAINNTIAIYQNVFTDPITVNIYFRYASTDPCTGTPLPTDNGARSVWVYYTRDWATFRGALASDASSQNDTTAVSTIPTTPIVPNILPTSANGRAIGLATPGAITGQCGIGGTYDGIVTLNSTVPVSWTRPPAANAYDAMRSIEHEIDEVLGIGSVIDISGATDWRPEDLFSYSAPGVRNVTTTGNRYFSINGGNTSVIALNQAAGLDHGDWQSALTCPQANPFVQNALVCPGQASDISRTSPEGTVLDVLGYNLAPPTAAIVSVSGRVMTASGSGIRNARVSMAAPDGTNLYAFTNAFGYYTFDNVESGRDYLMNAVAKGYTFDSHLVSVRDTVAGMDFTASQ